MALLSISIAEGNKGNGLDKKIISKISRSFLCRPHMDFIEDKLNKSYSDNNSNCNDSYDNISYDSSNHSNNTLNSSCHNNTSSRNTSHNNLNELTPIKNLNNNSNNNNNDNSNSNNNKKKQIRIEKGDFSGNINGNLFSYSGSPRSSGVGFTGTHARTYKNCPSSNCKFLSRLLKTVLNEIVLIISLIK